MKQDNESKIPEPICKICYFDGKCSHKPTSINRCELFLKKKEVEMGDNISVSPMDTFQMGYDELKDLLEDLDTDS